MTARLVGATVLLILGVALTADPMWYWQMLGMLCLLFVPALTLDAAVRTMRER